MPTAAYAVTCKGHRGCHHHAEKDPSQTDRRTITASAMQPHANTTTAATTALSKSQDTPKDANNLAVAIQPHANITIAAVKVPSKRIGEDITAAVAM